MLTLNMREKATSIQRDIGIWSDYNWLSLQNMKEVFRYNGAKTYNVLPLSIKKNPLKLRRQKIFKAPCEVFVILFRYF